MIRDIILIFLGGGLGSVGRYGISLGLRPYSHTLHGFPVHTFATNIIGCLTIGLLMGFVAKHPNQTVSMLLVAGFCGGFTTFSTFSFESMDLLKNGQYGVATCYIVLSFVLCVASAAVGWKIAD